MLTPTKDHIERKPFRETVLILVGFFFSAGLAFAQPLQKAVAMVGARSGASWPLWIAKDARDASLLIRARLEFAEEGPAGFSIGFAPLPKPHGTSGPDTA